MAESLLVSIINSVTAKIASTLPQLKIPSRRRDLNMLKSDLDSIHPKLSIVDKMVNTAEKKVWLGKVKGALYHLNDVLDEFLDQVLKHELRKVYQILLFLDELKLIQEIKISRETLKGILKEFFKFKLTDGSHFSASDHTVSQHITRSKRTHQYDVIKREPEKKHVIAFLFKNDTNVSNILSIVGSGGLGKTTLANSVYQDEEVNKHFELTLWVRASEYFDIFQLRAGIIKSASNKNLNALSNDELNVETRSLDILKGKRFLLVIDHMSYEDWTIWKELKEMLSKGGSGSKILITTRGRLVTSSPNFVETYMLPELDLEQSKSLFYKFAFDREAEIRDKNKLMEIGDDIVAKCVGIPLGLIHLGSVLHMNDSKEEWNSIRNHKMWETYDTDRRLTPALKLSYEWLPPHLKRCFASWALYPKHHEIPGIELVQLWMAQGLIIPTDTEDELKVGESYLKEFWSRSFIQQTADEFNIYSECTMHDLVHDLALLLVSENEFWSVNFHTHNVPKTVRHISFNYGDLSTESLIDLNVFLRTILFPVEGVRSTNIKGFEKWITKFKHLRVLDLSDTSYESLPDFVCKLDYLRLLSLSDNRSIKKLPMFICKLQNLETLRLDGCSQFEKLPRDIGNLTNLKFLYITTKQESLKITSLMKLRFLSITSCINLKSLHLALPTLCAMWITNCKSLESYYCVPELLTLKINGCPKLTGTSQQGTGEDCSKIEAIPDITTDNQKIIKLAGRSTQPLVS